MIQIRLLWGKISHFTVGTLVVSVTITLRAEVNLAWWLAWTSNPVGFTGRWARWVRFPCTSATLVFNELTAFPLLASLPLAF